MTAPKVPVQPVQPVRPVSLGDPSVLNDVRAWFERFVTVIDDTDLDLLTVWAAHTHLVIETYTTPRLIIDSPVPGSGKTTVLEHLERLCHHPVQMASLSSPALLVRMLDAGLRTILIDEADRSLRPDKPDVADLLAVLNSGYKRGATRPVLVPVKGGSWAAKEMPTYSPVAMAGNDPNLPDDTKSRSIRVLLMPDIDGSAEESDWELYEEEARSLGELLAAWADVVRDDIRANRPNMPEGVRGRARERWAPLKRVAVAAGGDWPDLVDRLAVQDVERLANEREEGIVQQRPHHAADPHLRGVAGRRNLRRHHRAHRPARPRSPRKLGRAVAVRQATHRATDGSNADEVRRPYQPTGLRRTSRIHPRQPRDRTSAHGCHPPRQTGRTG